MALERPLPTPHLRLVPSTTAAAGTAQAAADPPPVLVGLLLCADGGQALGVVREVLGWDGHHLSLRLTPDPGAQPGRPDITVCVPLAGCAPAAGHPKAVAP
jgi:hypothetical protein